MSIKEVDLIALAGLLHDIGKFRQRCGYNDITDGELATFCPSHTTHYSHLHAAHTAKAIEEMGFSKIKNLIQLAANHHLYQVTGDEAVIQKADRYASSLDRKNSKESLGKNKFITSGIEIPFSFIYFDDENKPNKYYYPIQKFEGDIKISNNKHCNDENRYKTLYEEFLKDVRQKNIKLDKFQDFLVLKSILEKYTTFIPSSTYKTYPDVSLFDHSLATAAIAVAIKNGDGENFSLIQGDFTSIQNFIFSKFGESNKYLAKILRAKSLFVNVATELIALKITKELNLSPYNIVMNAGGKFMILSHKLNEDDKKVLEDIKEWVNCEFKKINFLQTKFIIKNIDFRSESFELGKFKEVYKKMASEFEQEKLRFETDVNVFDGYIKEVSNGICEICGIVPTKDEVCKYCKKFKDIGEKLPKAKYINFNLDDLLSIEVSNEKEKEISFALDGYPNKKIANSVPKFSKSDTKNPRYKKIEDKFEEVKIGAIKSFYHIAADGLKIDGNDLIGKDYLAILKADIDNLGKIFICGFRDEITFSRVLYLSRMIDYFFTNILMDFIEDKNIYTVFAGGDDLFLIGHYEDIILAYEWIIDELKEYTKNQEFHLSAGIKLTKVNVPIPLMAKFTEDDLDEAKKIDGKDAVTIFDISLKNSEFKKILKLRDFFESIHSDLKKINSGTSFMYRFYDFFEMEYRLKRGENIVNNSRWKYLLRYLIEKNFEVKGKRDRNKETKERIKQALMELSSLIERYDRKLIIPLNLFLYSIRK